MKILVDYDLCEANAVCMRVAPEVFQVDKHDRLKVLAEHPGDELIDKVQKAVDRCPRGALSLVAD
jgi:ferredoxin